MHIIFMRLTLFTDYALRTLIYLGANPDRLCSIGEIAAGYGISRNHLMKVVNDLVRAGYVEGVRGRSGGLRLARPSDQIRIGDVVRQTEDSFDLVDCGSCVIAPACAMTQALHEATRAFLAVLDRYPLADLITDRAAVAALFLTAAPFAPSAEPSRLRPPDSAAGAP